MSGVERRWWRTWYRLNGGYDNIGIGGHTSNAMVDFTGGISQSTDLRKIRSSPGDLFDVMYAMMQKCSMMACDIQVVISHHYHHCHHLLHHHHYISRES